ncbi:MAG: hypothetical protein DDT32_00760 [Syntrophomonadaceae bacterium]|nr:hypothetical protein [Bacillota bacterium]
MMKHEQQTGRPEKVLNFFRGKNFLKLNLYEYFMKNQHKNQAVPETVIAKLPLKPSCTNKFIVTRKVQKWLGFSILAMFWVSRPVEAEPRLLLRDNFLDKEKSAAIWVDIKEKAVTFLSEGGVEIDGPKNKIIMITTLDPASDEWGDYSYEVTIKKLSKEDDANTWSGFIVRGILFLVRTGGFFSYVPEQTEVVVPRDPSSSILANGFELNKPYKIRFTCKGDEVEIAVNGERVGSVSGIPRTGEVGIAIYGEKSQFSDVTVLSLE